MDVDINGGEQTQGSGEEVVPYINRLLLEFGVVDNAKESAIFMEDAANGDDGDGESEGGEGEEGDNSNDSGSNWSNSDKEFDDETSDDDMECESDPTEDDLEIVVGGHERRAVGGDLSEDSKDLLIWRLDKEKSFSDWTIEISSEDGDGKEESVYHVHKAVLGTGPKKSGYFETLFQSDQFDESTHRKSTLKFPDSVAAGFPTFLDYMYAPPSESDRCINREHRSALQYLANYFVIPRLTNAIHTFIEKDMTKNVNRIKDYMSEFDSAESDDEARKIHSIVASVCTKMILHIKLGSSSPITTLTPAIMFCVFNAIRSNEYINSLSSEQQFRICNLGLSYINHHQHGLGEHVFSALCHVFYFPEKLNQAGKIATELLATMKRTGWQDESISSMCTAVVSGYLATRELSPYKIYSIACRLPDTTLAKILPNAITAERRENGTDITDVSCNIMEGEKITQVLKISFKSFHSVDFVQYLIYRKLGLTCTWDCAIRFEGRVLPSRECMSSFRVHSGSTLEFSPIMYGTRPEWN